MAVTFSTRLQHSWDAFKNPDVVKPSIKIGPGFGSRPEKKRSYRGGNRSIADTVFNQIAIDCAAIKMIHCVADEEGNYVRPKESGLNNVLNLEANIDQCSRDFMTDVVMSMFQEQVVAIVPTKTDVNPVDNGSFDIQEVRTGKVTQWYPQYVEVEIYDEHTGMHARRVYPKRKVAIIPNPFSASWDAPGSVYNRLMRKMSLLDAIDEQSGSGKLDMIIQLPYAVKGAVRERQAEKRREAIENQLKDSKYGIAYIDATEHITQLNRSLENNLLKQIEYLTEMFYNQLGLSQAVFDGTATEEQMLNYYSRTIEPILATISQELSRKFLTKTARTQGQTIMFFRNPFKLVPAEKIADIADKFTRNAILSSNELRAIVGYRPVQDERADELSNKNLNESPDAPPPPSTNPEVAQRNNEQAQQSYDSIGAVPVSQLRGIMGETNTE